MLPFSDRSFSQIIIECFDARVSRLFRHTLTVSCYSGHGSWSQIRWYLTNVTQVQAIVDHHHNVDVKIATKVRFQEPGSQNPNAVDEAQEKLVQETEASKEGEPGEVNETGEEAKEVNEEEAKLIGGSPKQENKDNTENTEKEAKENEEKKTDSPESKKPAITPWVITI